MVWTEFEYTKTAQAELESLISRDRLQSYLTARNGSLAEALDLYVWNCAVSASLYGPLQAVEIALRNAIHKVLATQISHDWPRDTRFLSIAPAFARDVVDAEAKIVRNWVRKGTPLGTPSIKVGAVQASLEARARSSGGTVATTSRIVAGLSFGFWVAMFKKEHQHTLFGPYLSKILPPGVKRATANAPLHRLRDLRNRIAHHEPIHTLRLDDLYRDVLQVADWLSPALPAWICHHSRCPLLINDAKRQRPQF